MKKTKFLLLIPLTGLLWILLFSCSKEDLSKTQQVKQVNIDTKSTDEDVQVVFLTSGSSLITLMQGNYQLRLSFYTPWYTENDVAYVYYYIAKTGDDPLKDGEGHYLDGGVSMLSYSGNPLKAGIWDIQAQVRFNDGETYDSDIVTVTVEYPPREVIKSWVSSDMDDAWQKTKEFAEKNHGKYKEYGFCLYAYLDRDIYELRIDSPFQTGNTSECGEDATLTLYNSPHPSTDPSQGGKYLIGLFHTHPPLTYCSSRVSRNPTGASSIDTSNLRPNTLGFVYDYSQGSIKGGHDINLGAKVYDYGPEELAVSSMD
ncbi:MAG: hypothetical protein COC06_05425 [Bacteroidales bacterium]|nr:MAG: hypothetical protein COC06_05425 [Bacteroidales bacterium]